MGLKTAKNGLLEGVIYDKLHAIEPQVLAEYTQGSILKVDDVIMGKPRSGLTDKQRRFAELVASGQHSQSAAYKLAGYGSGSSPKTIRQAASRLMTNADIIATIEAERARKRAAEAAASYSLRDKVMTKLEEAMDMDTLSQTQLRAAELLARASGLLNQTVSVESVDRSAEQVTADLEQRLAALLSTSPEQSGLAEDPEDFPDSALH